MFRVLLVEDNEGDVDIVRAALDNWRDGCRLTVAYDGLEALHCLRQGPCAEAKPDLILLDINMPGMDGKECLRELKRDDTLKCLSADILSRMNLL